MCRSKKHFYILSIITLFALACQRVHADIMFDDHTSIQKVTVGDTVEYQAALSWESSDGPVKIINITPPSAQFFELLSSREMNSTELSGGKTIHKKIFLYTFAAKEQGGSSIGGMQLTYTAKDSPDAQIVKGNAYSAEIVAPGVIFREHLIRYLSYFLILALMLCVIVWICTLLKPKELSLSSEGKNILPAENYLEEIRTISPNAVQSMNAETLKALEKIIKKYVREKFKVQLVDLRDAEHREILVKDTGLISLCRLIGESLEKVVFGRYSMSSDEGKRILKACERYFKSKIPENNLEVGLRLRQEV